MKRIAIVLFGITLFLTAHPPQGAATAPLSEVEALVAEALTNNPEIAASREKWQMLVAKSQQAGALDDPMLMLKIQNAMINDPLAFDKDPMTAKVIGISQMLPFAGKRDLLRTVAAQNAKSVEWEHAERKVELRRMVLDAWAQLALVNNSLRLVTENIALLDSVNRLAETGYSTGMVRQNDVLRSQLERSRMEEMRIGLEQRQKSLAAMFAALLHRSMDAPPPRASATIVPVAQTAAELEELAFRSRPELLARSARLEQAQSSENLARREYYPDFTLSFEYMQRDAFSGNPGSMGEDMYSAGVSFNLPVQRQARRAMVAEAQAQGKMAAAEIEQLRHEIRRGISDTLARLNASAAMAELYESGMIPQAEFASESLLSSYEVGKGDLMNVLDSRMQLFGVRQRYYEFVAENQMQRAELEALVGARID
ncbi:MAG: TolC family protein [Desulfuromonadales bacterium]|nr:TolC family protein [Desulfuromonadales bacterium]